MMRRLQMVSGAAAAAFGLVASLAVAGSQSPPAALATTASHARATTATAGRATTAAKLTGLVVRPHPDPLIVRPHPDPLVVRPHPDPLIVRPHPKPLVVRPHQGDDPNSAGKPPAGAACRLDFGVSECFTPAMLRKAYGLSSLLARDKGKGETIVIVDSFGSPTIAHDLKVFDAGYHLPAPPSLRVLAPLGKTKFTDAGDQFGWAEETTLDVEWAHAMAPLAGIVLLTSPVDETEGTAGLGDFLNLERYALRHHLGQVISQSWAATENTLFTKKGRALVASYEAFYRKATAAHITIIAGSGDTGTENPANPSGSRDYTSPTVNFPASSPYVTAVGGTSLRTSASGAWKSERVWNDSSGAGGGGRSQLFAEPAWQRSLRPATQALLQGHRGLPDVAWNADPNTAILIYASFAGGGGWSATGGTSEGSPQWAGLVADVDQARGNAIGPLNPILYSLPKSDFHDITKGGNGFGGVKGYRAGPGWDAASGLGTPKAALIKALIKARRR